MVKYWSQRNEWKATLSFLYCSLSFLIYMNKHFTLKGMSDWVTFKACNHYYYDI